MPRPADPHARRSCVYTGLALVTALVASSARAEWGVDFPISGAGANTAYSGPSVGLASDRSAVLAWRDNAYDVRVATRDGAAGTWTFKLLSGSTNTSVPTVVMNDAGDAVVAWTGFNYASAAYRPAGGNFGPVATLQAGKVYGNAQAAIDSAGNAVVSWVSIDSGNTAYEVHAALRSKWGTWPASGAFEIAGGPTNSFAESAVAIDDAGHVAVAWVEDYADFDDTPAAHHVNVVSAAVRAPGGGWSAAKDLSPRGSGSGLFHCEAGHAAMPTASGPVFSADPETGALAVTYLFDPTSYEYESQDSLCQPTPADGKVRRAEGTVASPPVGGSDLGTWVGINGLGSEPKISLRKGRIAMAWAEAETGNARTVLAVGPLGGSLGTTTLAQALTTAVAMGGEARGFFAGYRYQSGSFITNGASMLASGSSDGPTPISSNAAVQSVAASCGDYALAGLVGQDGKIHIAEYPGSAPACAVFADTFETGGLTRWSAHSP